MLIILIIVSFSFDNSICNEYNHQAKVVQVFSNSIIVKEDGQKYFLSSVGDSFNVGDVISYDGYYQDPNTIGSFKMFLRQNNCASSLFPNNVEILKHSHSLRNNIKESLIKCNDAYSNFTLAILYKYDHGNSSNIISFSTNLGVSHIFVISGFHIGLLYFGTRELLVKIINKKNQSRYISLLITFIFMYLIFFPRTAVRAFVMLLLWETTRLTKLDCLFVTGLIFMMLNPFVLTSGSMMLSFTITFMFLNYFTIKDITLLSFFKMNICAYMMSLPILLTWNNSFNLLSPILTICISPVIEFAYIVSILLLPFKILWPIASVLYIVIEFILMIFSVLNIQIYLENINLFSELALLLITNQYIPIYKNDKYTMIITFVIINLTLFII